jgi:hypothetical protein
MLRFTAALLLLCTAAHAEDAPKLVGIASRGVAIYLDQAGNADFRAGEVIWLDNGRELHRDGEHWKLIPASDVPTADLKSIEMALYGDRFLGKRVHVQGAEVYAVTVEWGLLRLPGASVVVMFKGASREALRPLVEHCQGFVQNPACAVDITATVANATTARLCWLIPRCPFRKCHPAPIRSRLRASEALLRAKVAAGTDFQHPLAEAPGRRRFPVSRPPSCAARR